MVCSEMSSTKLEKKQPTSSRVWNPSPTVPGADEHASQWDAPQECQQIAQQTGTSGQAAVDALEIYGNS